MRKTKKTVTSLLVASMLSATLLSPALAYGEAGIGSKNVTAANHEASPIAWHDIPALEAAILDWEAVNQDPALSVQTISEENLSFFRSLPQNVDIELYKRKIPDQRTQFTRQGVAPIELGEVPVWYQGGPVSEKPDQLLQRMAAAHNAPKFADNYKFTINDSPLSILLMGKADSITKANEAIVSRGVKEFAFTDTEAYYLYFQHQDKLTQQSKDILYQLIVSMAQNQGFSPEKAELDFLYNNNHNQTSEGLLRGFMYAQAANDASMFARMENVLDRMIAYEALQGSGTGDFNSPSYAAFTWSNMLTLYTLTDNERIKAKLRLILDRAGMDAAMRYHEPSASMPGPFNRTFGRFNFRNVDRQSFFNILYRSTSGYNFYQFHEANGYAWWYANLASLTPFFPDYMEEIAFRKEFPYRTWSTKLRNATPGAYNVSAGNQGYTIPNTRYKMGNTVSYATYEYNIGSAGDFAWYIPGYDGQDALLLANWRRTDGLIKSLSDTGTLFSNYRYNSDIDVSGVSPVVKELTAQSWSFPKEHGLSAVLQHDNKAIVLSYPGKAADARFTDVKTNEINDMGVSLFVGWPEEMKAVWAGDDFIMGEVSLVQNGVEEVRARIAGQALPYNIDGNKKIYIEDHNTFIALQPLNTTDLGRDMEGQIRSMGEDLAGDAASLKSMPIESLLTIHFYNYHGAEAKTVGLNARSQQRNGYILEMGDRTQYSSMQAFKAHMASTAYTQQDQNGLWVTTYQSGVDQLQLEFDLTDLVVKKRMVNGQLLLDKTYELDQNGPVYVTADNTQYYSWMNKEPYLSTPEMVRSNNMVQSTETLICLQDAVLHNPDGAMVYLIAEPNQDIYVLGNLTGRSSDFTLETPHGTVEISDFNLGRIVFRPQQTEPLEIDPVPGLSSPVVELD
ncbi:MAG: hypothetical protein K0R57_250 [Paenibacillaceae bacterium]|nr:hypothetical protein [Paenibacillaceae bacterium]